MDYVQRPGADVVDRALSAMIGGTSHSSAPCLASLNASAES
jgi:pyruvate carboxylase